MAKMKNPGKFDKRIQIQTQISTPVRGGRDISWQDRGEVIWAEVEEARRYLTISEGTKKTVIETSFKTRYDPYLFDLKPPQVRVKYDRKAYAAIRLENVETNFRYMKIHTDGNAWQLLSEVE